MPGFLNQKTAIVTGGTRGIGYAIAEALLREGAAVAICGRSEANVDKAVQKLRAATNGKAAGAVADVSKREDVERFFQFADRELGGLDILVNNAGIGVFAPMAEMTPQDFYRVIETNLTGAFHCCQLAAPRMKKRGGGAMIQIGSLAGKNPFAGGSAYNASKFALNGFAEAMMLDHRYDGIRVSNICPGSVDTDFQPGREPSAWRTQPEDIAEIVLTVLRLPERTMMSYVEVRPSQPPRKR
jgi:3-oxoacyl-[acyl-carrier protein] reductase